jgi:hypothetical protein
VRTIAFEMPPILSQSLGDFLTLAQTLNLHVHGSLLEAAVPEPHLVVSPNTESKGLYGETTKWHPGTLCVLAARLERRKPTPKQQSFPPGRPSECRVGGVQGMLLAPSSADNDLTVGPYGDHRPELVHLVEVVVAEWRRVNALGVRARTYGILLLRVNNGIAKSEIGFQLIALPSPLRGSNVGLKSPYHDPIMKGRRRRWKKINLFRNCGIEETPMRPRPSAKLTFFVIAAALAALAVIQLPGQEVKKTTAPARPVQLGANASLAGRRAFPDDNAWNCDISHVPVDPNSDTYIASMGADAELHPDFGTEYEGAPWGIPYIVVPGSQPRLPVTFEYADESDQCFYPIPPDVPIEGGPESMGDRHVVILDRDNWKLYEMFGARKENDHWLAGSGAGFDLNSNALRPAGWTSADAAGLPIFPGLVRYDEVFEQKEIRHALRFTAKPTRRAYIYPARHWASSMDDAGLPPMGLRVRLKASFDISKFPPTAQVILKALKKYGMILADNGQSWFLSGSPHPKWNNQELDTLKQVKGQSFEVIRIGNIVTP